VLWPIPGQVSGIDTDARPDWLRTGYTYFLYAARQRGRWWVLRLNVATVGESHLARLSKEQ
jgi:hypothetical protein